MSNEERALWKKLDNADGRRFVALACVFVSEVMSVIIMFLFLTDAIKDDGMATFKAYTMGTCVWCVCSMIMYCLFTCKVKNIEHELRAFDTQE